MPLTRRQALMSGAALPLAAAAGTPALADGHSAGPAVKSQDFTVGDFTVSTLLVGSMPREDPQSIFGMNVSAEEFAEVSEENFLPTDMAQFFFTPTLVNTGSELILFDTGLNPAAITAALADAGTSPEAITHVVLTHMHGDHIGGMADDGGNPTFPNAALITGQVEYDYWAAQGNDGFNAKVAPFAEKFSFLGDGDEVRSGITAMAAFGHTPGHMTYRIESGGQSLVLIADLANHPVYSLAYPDWEVRFDADKEAAAQARRTVLGMLAADKTPFIGYHMPFPALGYVEERGEGFNYVPHSYQLL